jgi:hypothetical protein
MPVIKKWIPLLTSITAIIGLLWALCLGALQWRIIWIANNPGPNAVGLIDWNPYPEFLIMTLNWWTPFAALICAVSARLTKKSKRSAVLKIGWALHALSAFSLLGLAVWVFTVPLPGGLSQVWWLWFAD